MNSKYSNFLTILLVVIIIIIVGIIGFLGYKYYTTYITKSNSEDFVDTFGDGLTEGEIKDNPEENIEFEGVDEGKENNNTNNSTEGKRKKYNGFDAAGTIEIPKTNLKSPILEQYEYSPKALETAVVVLYGPGLNQPGNTTIAGHNYRSSVFFSNNKKLNIGDKIYVTDYTGKRLAYTIYDKFETTESDSEYITRDTQGAIEISLTTCTDDSKARLIILAKADV